MTLKKQASASNIHSSIDAGLHLAAPALARPPVLDGTSASSDESIHLVAQLRQDGFAHLRPAKPEARANDAKRTAPMSRLATSDGDDDEDDGDDGDNADNAGDADTAARLRAASASSDENYDALEIDPATVVRGGKGGGFDAAATLSNPLRLSPVSAAENADILEPSTLAAKANATSLHERRNGISVKLEKTGTKGRYILKAADEPELKAFLRVWTQREADGLDMKRRSKFSDLVFTRQFTAFDRQNPTSASSPFHGFFTLFWLGTFLLLVKIAARNWKFHGSIFGPNEIMRMMFHEDVLVLGLTDGVMCASTTFCLVLQKAILAGYISWNKHGWIIQNVGKAFLLLFATEDHMNLMPAWSYVKGGIQ